MDFKILIAIILGIFIIFVILLLPSGSSEIEKLNKEIESLQKFLNIEKEKNQRACEYNMNLMKDLENIREYNNLLDERNLDLLEENEKLQKKNRLYRDSCLEYKSYDNYTTQNISDIEKRNLEVITLLAALSTTDKYKSKFTKSRLNFDRSGDNDKFILEISAGIDEYYHYTLDIKYWDLFNVEVRKEAHKVTTEDTNMLKRFFY